MKNRKRKIVHYRLILLLLFVAFCVGMGFYFIHLDASKLTEDGVAFSMEITFDQKIDSPVAFYLKTDKSQRMDLVKLNDAKKYKMDELLFFKGQATLYAQVNGEELVLVKKIEAKDRDSLIVTSTVREKDKRVHIKSSYYKRSTVDFAKFKKKLLDEQPRKNDIK